MAFLARLGVVLGLDSAEFSKGIDNATQRLASFSGAAKNAALVGAAAFAAMTAKALQYADAVEDTAKANDMAIESILALGKGLRENGGDAANATKFISAFTAKVDEAAEGSKSAQVMFERIGISLKDIAKLDITDLFDKTLDSLSKIEDPIKRNALAFQAFGRAAKGVDFLELAKGSKEAREEFKQYADEIKLAAKMNDKLEEASNKIILNFTKKLIPTITTIFEELNKAGSVFDKLLTAIDYFISHFAFGLKFIAGVIETTFYALQSLGAYLNDLMSLNFNTAQKRLDEYLAKAKQVQTEIMQFGKKLFYPEPPKSKPNTPLGDRPVIDADAESIKKAQELSAEYARQQMLKYEQVQRQTYLLSLSEKEKQIALAIYDIEDARAQKVFDIQKKINEEKAKARPSEKIISALQEEISTVNAVAQAYKEMTEAEIKRQQELQNSFEFGWNKAFKQYAEDAENYAKQGQQSFEVFSNTISAAIDRFVQTGKFSFNDFVKSILLGLLKIQLQMQAMQLFNSGKSWISGLFGLGGGGSWADDGTGFMSLATAADGGMITGPTLVGENGPELFVPQTSGTVIPNQQLSSYSASQPQVVYNGPYIENMQAIDTQSAAQFLAKNKSAVWAANQSASRSMPQSR